MARIICILAALLLPWPTKADTPHFKVERLRVPGRVLGVLVEDLNGDGKKDIIVAFLHGRAPQATRRVAVFFAKGQSLGAEPDQVLEPPPSASFLDVADLDGTGARAILYADGRHLSAWRLGPDRARFAAAAQPLFKLTGLLSLPDPDDLPFLDVGRDWDGDGKTELLVPLVEGVGVFTREDGAWVRTGYLRIPMRADYAVRSQQYEPRLRNFTLRATFVMPELVVADYDGDGKADLFAVVADLLQVHKGGAGKSVFSEQPVARHFLGVRTEAEIARQSAHVHTSVRDLDGDGVADLVVNKITGGLGQMKAATGFYYGRRGGGYDPPAQLLERDGYAGALAFGDLDGDGKPELVMPHVAVGLGEMARVLLSKKMLVGWEIRKNHGRKFSPLADAVKQVDFHVDYSQLADIDGPFPSVAGDFNGDGKVDFVAAHGPEQMAVWPGGGKGLVADTPKALVRVPPTRFYQVVDLDGDRRADMVLFYRGRDSHAGVVNVLRNTGQGW